MKEFVEKLIDKTEEKVKVTSLEIIVTGTKDKPYFQIKYKEIGKEDYNIGYGSYDLNNVFCWKEECFEIVKQLAEEYNNGWIPCSERLPECENKYGWVSCIVSVIRSHYPTSPYDVCDSPYDENIVMHANYHVSQKIWHLEGDEQLNALIDIEDSPLNGDYVIAWQPLPEPYKG